MPPSLEAQNLNHWPTREVPVGWILNKMFKKEKVELNLSSEVKGQGSHAKFRKKQALGKRTDAAKATRRPGREWTEEGKSDGEKRAGVNDVESHEPREQFAALSSR